MAKVSRRHFLQASGALLTSMGINQLQAQRYGRVLAQSTPRKLALLVGINNYANAPLEGCVNDVILQRQLLIHRFGFNPSDIMTLLDEQADRQGMLEAFEEHLIQQAKPGDVVVFHYSGHGSLVRDPDPVFTNRRGDGLNGTFVPVDSSLPENYPNEDGTVKDIMGHTLFLLMSAIQTENFTAVLDSCFSAAASRQEGLTVRSREGGDKVTVAPQELEYQDRWLSKLDWSRQEFVERYQRGIGNGVVLASAQRNQYAVDEQLNGFSAGAFTYRLTQHLWQTDSTPEDAIAHINSIMPRGYRQNPQIEAEVGSGYEQRLMFFTENLQPTADAIVMEVEQDQVRILLVGIEPNTVNFGQRLIGLNSRGGVFVSARDGLTAQGVVIGELQVGDRLRLLQN